MISIYYVRQPERIILMKFFLKDNSYSIFKMFVNQLGMTIFGITLSFATHQNNSLLLLTSVFGACFYMVLLYTMTWDIGYEEKIRIEGKRLRYIPLKGLYMSLAANAVNFILAAMVIIGYYSSTSFVNGAPASPEWAMNIYGIGRAVAALLEGMYGGIISIVFDSNPWAYLIVILPSLLVCLLAYIAGVKGFRILPAPKNPNRE